MGKKYSKMPTGIILILVLISINLYGRLISLNDYFFQLGPILFVGISSSIAHLILALIMGGILFGIVKRYKWTWKLTIGWFLFSILLAGINVISFYSDKSMFDAFFQKSALFEESLLFSQNLMETALVFGGAISLGLGAFIIRYLRKKKDFFVN